MKMISQHDICLEFKGMDFFDLFQDRKKKCSMSDFNFS
jgi:hypothetical protein